MKKVNQKVENEFWNKTVREIHYKIRPKFSDDIYMTLQNTVWIGVGGVIQSTYERVRRRVRLEYDV